MAILANQSERINFSSIKSILDYPDFLDVQVKSFEDFFQLETPADKRTSGWSVSRFSLRTFPISDSRENFVLEFVDYLVDPPKYDVAECIDRGLTYSVPLKAKLRLTCNDEDNEDFETIEQEVFLGNIPYMTEKGSFVVSMVPKELLYLNYTDLLVYSLRRASTPTELHCILRELFLSKDLGLNLLPM